MQNLKMPYEKSCGGVIFRKNKEIKYLLLQYEYKTTYWDFVKGNIEEGEEEKDTLIREIREETGITEINLIPNFREKITFFYKREGKTIRKEVIFYLVETKEKEIKLSEEHIGYVWLNYKEALERLTFKNAKEILKKADAFLGHKKIS